MKKNMSLGTYRFVDIFVFTVLMILFEFLATNFVDTSLYSVSLFIPLTLIVMMRWNIWSIIIIIASAITYVYANNGTSDNYLIYIIGDLFILFNLLWLIKYKQNIKEKNYMCIIYVISGYFLVEVGRSIVSACLGYDFFKILLSFLGTDSLSVLVGLVVILIARKQNGLFEDQIEYLKRINAEENLNEN